jgi:dynein light intermediate chain
MSIPFKNKEEKLEYIKQDIIQNSKINIQRAQNITLNNSLVKYDTPFLVSSTTKNKKTLQDLEENDEEANLYLRNIIFSNNKKGNFTENVEFKVKDALNKILPPKKIIMNGQLWVQYVSCTPVTKMEVITLKEGLDKRIKTLNAKETGICPIREELYDECFDELIRQVTINCLERGILMMLVKQESVMTMKAYQDLYQSSVAYGIRNGLIAEEEKKKLRSQIEVTDERNEKLEEDIDKLEKEIELLIKNDEEERKEVQEKHLQEIAVREDQIKMLKAEIKNKWEILSKQMG